MWTCISDYIPVYVYSIYGLCRLCHLTSLLSNHQKDFKEKMSYISTVLKYILIANITLTSFWNIFSCSTTERCDTIGPKLLAQEFRMADQTSVNAAMINF